MKLNVIEKQRMKNIKKLEKHPIDMFGFKYGPFSKHWGNDLNYEDYYRNTVLNHTKVDPNKAAEDYALLGWEY